MTTPRQALQGPGAGGLARIGKITPAAPQQGKQAADMGDALLGAGSQAYRLTQSMQDDLDEANFEMNVSRFAEKIGEAKTAFDEVGGADANDAFEKTKRDLERQRNELEKNLTSSKQRRAFGVAAKNRLDIALNQMNAARADKLKDYRVAATTQSVEQLARERVNAALEGDVMSYVRSSFVMAVKTNQLGELLQVPPNVLDQMKADGESTVNVGIVEGLLAQNRYERADKFFADNSESIQDPKKRAALRTRIQRANIETRADALLDDIRQQHPDSIVRQREAVRDLDAPMEVKLKAMEFLRVMYAEDNAERNRAKAEAIAEADTLLNTGAPMTEALAGKLTELGIYDSYVSARAMNPNRETTPEGDRLMFLFTEEPGRLTEQFPTPEAAHAALYMVLGESDMRRVAKMHHDQRLLESKTGTETAAGRRQFGTGAAGQRVEGATTGFKMSDAQINAELFAQLRAVAPKRYGQATRFEDLSNPQTVEVKTLLVNFQRRAEQLARAKGAKPDDSDIVRDAIADVLSFQTTDGGFFYGSTSQEGLEIQLGDGDADGEFTTFQPFRVKVPGETQAPDTPLVLAHKALVERDAMAMAEMQGAVWADMSESARDAYRTQAGHLVGEVDAIRAVSAALEERNKKHREISKLHGQLDAVPKEMLEQKFFGIPLADPAMKDRNRSILLAENLWDRWHEAALEKGWGDLGATEAEMFVELWPEFYKQYGTVLNDTAGSADSIFGEAGHATNVAQGESVARDAFVDVVFGNASEDLRNAMKLYSRTGDVQAFRSIHIAGNDNMGQPRYGAGGTDPATLMEFAEKTRNIRR